MCRARRESGALIYLVVITARELRTLQVHFIVIELHSTDNNLKEWPKYGGKTCTDGLLVD